MLYKIRIMFNVCVCVSVYINVNGLLFCDKNFLVMVFSLFVFLYIYLCVQYDDDDGDDKAQHNPMYAYAPSVSFR